MKWLSRAALALVLAYAVVACIGMFATWRECTAAGGLTVRGLFGLECIRQ